VHLSFDCKQDGDGCVLRAVSSAAEKCDGNLNYIDKCRRNMFT
jgi:hypothetical protein